MERIVRLVCVICLLVLPIGIAYAQEDTGYEYTEYDEEEYEEQVVEEKDVETTEYVFGTVVSIDNKASEIVVSKYDWRSGEDIDVTFTVDSNIRVEGFSSWKSIPVGAYVDIDYITDKTGKKIAKSISISEDTE